MKGDTFLPRGRVESEFFVEISMRQRASAAREGKDILNKGSTCWRERKSRSRWLWVDARVLRRMRSRTMKYSRIFFLGLRRCVCWIRAPIGPIGKDVCGIRRYVSLETAEVDYTPRTLALSPLPRMQAQAGERVSVKTAREKSAPDVTDAEKRKPDSFVSREGKGVGREEGAAGCSSS